MGWLRLHSDGPRVERQPGAAPTPAVSKCEIVDESHNSAVSHPKLVPKCQEPPPNRQRMSLSPAQLEAEPVAVVVDQFWMHGQLRIAESI